MSGFLDHIAVAPTITVAELVQDRPLVVLAPHPDDETLGCGAILFDAARMGTACSIICVTDGSASHPGSREYPPDRIARLREAELRAACAILAPDADVTWLGYPDCHAPRDAAAAERIAAMMPPRAMLLASWGGDPHIDHESCAALARLIADLRPDILLRFYPIWGRFTDATAPAVHLRTTPEAAAAKARALACHRSQMTKMIDDDPDGFVMSEAHQQHFLSYPEVILAL
ncbi:PIG-L family deacetylase [Paracoccus sp. 1_MG-2023]|uniref:PIG-L deacetylase family protein n=1 Tax=unclassified Paracoccus (in: a-proteobacteria) TaxID=2688777 RepID=UPI001C094BED|nr:MULTISPECIES: PIG-L family deacetylase [unclassified Paracoccus (in: a-proteobacteria)]MBU2957625.1 PIG-L family deacetylase [Paracoccus sp. C2R09]MDO6667528.1 PIG-L family deacetylase [Paracoccus sp. 1_MG-2023]